MALRINKQLGQSGVRKNVVLFIGFLESVWTVKKSVINEDSRNSTDMREATCQADVASQYPSNRREHVLKEKHRFRFRASANRRLEQGDSHRHDRNFGKFRQSAPSAVWGNEGFTDLSASWISYCGL